tara:strand:- start:1026 stop:1262 length:237 start_codon:yes stop_codon:yes gene_type:complete
MENDIIRDLEVEGAWFGVHDISHYPKDGQIQMFISDRYVNSDSLFQDVVEFFEDEFLPDRGLTLDDVFLHGDLTIFYS